MDIKILRWKKQYQMVTDLYIKKGYTIANACKKIGISKAKYYQISKLLREENNKENKKMNTKEEDSSDGEVKEEEDSSDGEVKEEEDSSDEEVKEEEDSSDEEVKEEEDECKQLINNIKENNYKYHNCQEKIKC
uniref:Transcriptional regulator n=1 Tax=Moumouvirus australiensis transpoviron TaxID=2711276 RepID=A0A2P1EHI6_9VIRU|nr:transcriptional regulator [Moumouvirus australiensis transpoviron]